MSWTIIAGFLFTTGHFAAMMALATHLHGARQGYRRLRPAVHRARAALTLESALILGGSMIGLCALALSAIAVKWSIGGFVALPSVLPLTIAAVIGTTGVQTMLGGFLLAIIAGHDAKLAPDLIVPNMDGLGVMEAA